MRIAGIRELRAQSAILLGGDEPILVTKHGKISGVYLPLDDPNKLPDDLRREFLNALGRYLEKLLSCWGITDKDVSKDFNAYRRRRC